MKKKNISDICEETLKYVGTNFPFSYTGQLKWSKNYAIHLLI